VAPAAEVVTATRMHFQGPQPQEVLLVIPDKVLLLNILLLLILEVAVEVGEPPVGLLALTILKAQQASRGEQEAKQLH
jgi:hypothetical protein